MNNEDAIKWLENLKQDIGQLRHEDLWPCAQVIDEIIATMEEQKAVEPILRHGGDGIFVWACGSCGAYMYHIYDGIDKAKKYAKYCRQCGKNVKWE